MYKAANEIYFGIYACSPEESSFKATFTNMEITECKWLAHDGQAPDEGKMILTADGCYAARVPIGLCELQ